MKKILIYILLIVSVISCREKEQRPGDGPVAISFSVPEVADTKSVLITEVEHLVTGQDELGFTVFAARYIPSETGTITHHEQFMNDVKVSKPLTGTEWSYDMDPNAEGNQLVYWSPGAIHKFFAVYPYYDKTNDDYDYGLSYEIDTVKHALKVNGKHEVEPSKKFICTGVDSLTKQNLCPDILYGVQMFAEPYEVGENRGPITFTLTHALSAVSFRFRNASEFPITKILCTDVSGFKNVAETVWLSDDGPVWSGLDFIDDHKFVVPDMIAIKESDYIKSGATYSPDGSAYWYTALIIPQNFGVYETSPSFTFTVTMIDHELESITKTYTIDFKKYPVNNTAEYGFTYLPGYRYVYNFNVTSSKVSCDVDVAPWIDDEPIKLN